MLIKVDQGKVLYYGVSEKRGGSRHEEGGNCTGGIIYCGAREGLVIISFDEEEYYGFRKSKKGDVERQGA